MELNVLLRRMLYLVQYSLLYSSPLSSEDFTDPVYNLCCYKSSFVELF